MNETEQRTVWKERGPTLLRSSAAISFFSMSSKEMSLLGDVVKVGAQSVTGDRGLRITSKAWPEARLLMGLTSMSVERESTSEKQPVQQLCQRSRYL